MKRFACLLLALTGTLVAADSARADFGSLHYGGHQPWWNIFAKRNPYMSVEEERLQRFWHDYYDALRRYYGMLDRIDWVAYYKNHGYQINGGSGGSGPGGSPSRIQYAPVFVSPSMQWAIPQGQGGGMLSGAPSGPGYVPPYAFPGAFPAFGGGGGPMGPGMGGPGMMGMGGPGGMMGGPGGMMGGPGGMMGGPGGMMPPMGMGGYPN